MGDAKSIVVKPIGRDDANRLVRKYHYSGKIVNNSQVHLGVFMGDRCGGAMQFGPSLDKRKMIGLVADTKWHEFIELNRMAFADWLPRNSESRAIGYAMRWLRKTYPQLKWVVSFADGTQCGDGTIYRASGFVLTSIKTNNQIWSKGDAMDHRVTETKGKKIIARSTVTARLSGIKHSPVLCAHERGGMRPGMIEAFCSASARPGIGAITNGAITNGASSMKKWKEAGFAPLPGFQLRYIYFLDPTARQRLTVPILPFTEITRRGAGMYKGKSRAGSSDSGTSPAQGEGGGSIPTPALSSSDLSP